jgi:pyruvate dehydrogenase E1 component beta subunit
MNAGESVRQLKFSEAIQEALELCMERDPAVYVMGLGVPDPKGIFNTTNRLRGRFGAERVLDMPCSENAMTGVALGSALAGMRPVLVHQRLDFALLSMEQIVNQAAKWHYMFNGRAAAPLVIRLVIGRGWGQGPQHSQALHAWFAHVPGLKVVLPATPHDAKGLLISSIEDDNPVIFLEHRWLHNISGPVPEGYYRTPLGEPVVLRSGDDVTIVATSLATLESSLAAESLQQQGVSAEVIDLRTINPLNDSLILQSVRKTRRLVVVDIGSRSVGLSGEIVSRVVESLGTQLLHNPVRIALPDIPTPSSPSLARDFYPRVDDIEQAILAHLGRSLGAREHSPPHGPPWFDTPDPSFTGPF